MIYDKDVSAICLLREDRIIDNDRQLKELAPLCSFVLWTISDLINTNTGRESRERKYVGNYS